MAWSTLRTRTPLRRVNPERLAKRREQAFGLHGERVKALKCCACGALPPSDPHHYKTRQSQGGGDWRHITPLCRECHRKLDSPGWSQKAFEAEYGVNLPEVAALLASVSDDPPRRHGSTIPRLYARLALIPYRERLAMLRACPVRIPAPLARGDVLELSRWLEDRLLAAEVERVLDLYETLEAWCLERQGRV